MEINPQTSFIPKKPLTENNVRHSGLSFFSLIAFILFLASVAFAGGVVVYKAAIENDIKIQKQNLEKSRESFDTSFIGTIVRFNTRIETAKLLLKKHVAITPIFQLIQQNTVSSVTFRDFSFKPSQDGTLTIQMSGYARDYDSIAQQSDEFGRSRYFKDVLFSDLNPDNNGNIKFIFKAKVDPSLVSFENALQQNKPAPAPANANLEN